MEIKLHKSGAMSVQIGKQSMWLTPHAIERWKERISTDLESMCYRALVARRIPIRELKKFRRKSFGLRSISERHELREHGNVIFIVDPKKPIVITVIKAEYVK